MRLLYSAPSRIAINLYDMNGNLGRIDGGMGFSLERPRLRFAAEANTDIVIENDSLIPPELRAAVVSAIRTTLDTYGLEGIRIEFLEAIPLHCGFGCKTATILSVAHACGGVYGQAFDFRELGFLLGRGGTSGLGVNLIDRGGFVLEGGHSTVHKSAFLPSSTTHRVPIPPVLARHPMPSWDVLIVVPRTRRLHGDIEAAFFNRVCPVDQNDVESLARITLSQVLPAIVEQDIEVFASGVSCIQRCQWKASEISNYGRQVTGLMERIAKLGVLGIGMSSMGPCIYGFGSSCQDAVHALESLDVGTVHVTKPNNIGYEVTAL